VKEKKKKTFFILFSFTLNAYKCGYLQGVYAIKGDKRYCDKSSGETA
jgi:hypothetical protein